jgi:hypothetical protein
MFTNILMVRGRQVSAATPSVENLVDVLLNGALL